MNHLSAALAFGFGLLGNGALHLLRNIHLFHFNFADFDAPRLGVLIQNNLQLGVDFVALREDFIEFELADNAAQGGLGKLRSRVLIILHLRKRQVGVDDAEISRPR